MSTETLKNEERLRNQFDFEHATRGRYAERYQRGTQVTVLDGSADADDPLGAEAKDSQLIEIAGKHLLISRLIAAGYEVAEPIRDKGIDLIVYRDDRQFSAFPIQIKASTKESFSLDRKYEKFPNLQIAYVWNVNGVKPSEVYLLSFEQAVQVLVTKGFAKTDSWTKNGHYFVRSAGAELKALLEPYRMLAAGGQQKLQVIG